jgi:hypothetical protein
VVSFKTFKHQEHARQYTEYFDGEKARYLRNEEVD